MSSNNKDVLQWIGIGFLLLCGAWPVAAVLAFLKLRSRNDRKKQQEVRSRWNYQTAPGAARSDDFQPQPRPRPDPEKTAQQRSEAAIKRARHMMFGTGRGSGSKTLGWFLAIFNGLIGGVMLLDDLPSLSAGLLKFISASSSAFFLLAIAALGVFLIMRGNNQAKQAHRGRDYLNIIGTSSCISLQELSEITGTPADEVRDDLDDFLEAGCFGPDAYIDMSNGFLILTKDGSEEVFRQQAERVAQAAMNREPEEEAEEDPAVGILREIRKVNDRIPDPHLSEQIDRIEEITGLILRYQKEHPEKSSQLRTFLSYYLPTTLKILNSYADLEKQSIQGRNITDTKLRIEQVMDKVVAGFEEQLNQLFAEERLDITSDISALETMLEQDGLTGTGATSPFGTDFNRDFGGTGTGSSFGTDFNRDFGGTGTGSSFGTDFNRDFGGLGGV